MQHLPGLRKDTIRRHEPLQHRCYQFCRIGRGLTGLTRHHGGIVEQIAVNVRGKLYSQFDGLVVGNG